MAQWDYTLDVKAIWDNFETVGFEESRDQIVRRIRDSRFFTEEDWSLSNIVDELGWAEDLSEFNDWWNEFYDWADFARVWVKTF